MSKKLLAVAVALCVAVPSTFAGFDYFSVIEAGKGQATVGAYGGFDSWGLKIRYGLMDNLELYSSVGSAGLELWPYSDDPSTDYVLGARYQIIPLLSAFVDVGLPTMADKDHNYLGFVPGINFTMNVTDAFSIGSVAQLGIVLTDTTLVGAKKNAPVMNLKIGAEFDYQVSETVCLWLAVDYIMGALNMDKRSDEIGKDKPKGEEDAIQPGLGASFGNGDFGVATMVGLSLVHEAYKNGKDDVAAGTENGVGFWGGVEFTIGF
jgi:hypothetical protein